MQIISEDKWKVEYKQSTRFWYETHYLMTNRGINLQLTNHVRDDIPFRNNTHSFMVFVDGGNRRSDGISDNIRHHVLTHFSHFDIYNNERYRGLFIGFTSLDSLMEFIEKIKIVLQEQF